MPVFLNDTFTEASDTTATSHVGELGATWTRHAASGVLDIPVVDAADEIRSGNMTANQFIYASGTGANANQLAQITFINRATTGNGNVVAVALRSNTTSPLNGYHLYYINAATPFFRLYKIDGAGPSFTQIGSDYTYTLAAATEEEILFYAVGSEFRVYRNAGATLMITGSDSAISSAGRVVLRFSDFALTGATGGVNIASLQVYDTVALPGGASGVKRAGLRTTRGLYTR